MLYSGRSARLCYGPSCRTPLACSNAIYMHSSVQGLNTLVLLTPGGKYARFSKRNH